MTATALASADLAAQGSNTAPIGGRWNLTVTSPRSTYPSWLEVAPSGFTALVGQFVGRIGAARPISRVEWTADSTIRFAIPPQWERFPAELRLEGRLQGDSIVGTITNPNGMIHPFVGRRAPVLRRPDSPGWTAPVPLFNGRIPSST